MDRVEKVTVAVAAAAGAGFVALSMFGTGPKPDRACTGWRCVDVASTSTTTTATTTSRPSTTIARGPGDVTSGPFTSGPAR